MLGPIASTAAAAAAIATVNAIILFFTAAACNSFVCVKSFAHLAVIISNSPRTLFSVCFDLFHWFCSQDKELRHWTWTGSEENARTI